MTDIFKGATSNSVFIELVDSTTGLPKTGIVYTDVTGSYVRTRAARVAITMATLASASASFSSGGFILVDDTNQPGVYRFDVPDAAFATGVTAVVVTIKATGCRTVSRLFDLVDVNNQVAYAPNVAAAAIGGLLTAPTTANTGLADVTRLLGTAWLTPTTAGTPDVNLTTTALGAIWNRLTSSLTTVGSIGKWILDNLTGDIYARLGAPTGASVSADIAAVKAETATIVVDTNELQTDWANGGRLDLILDARASQTSVDDIPTNAELATALATGVNVTQIDGSNLGTHGIGQFPADVRDWGGLGAAIAIDADNSYPSVAAMHVHEDAISAESVSAAAVAKIQNGLATASELLLVKDRVSYCLTVLVGACSDAGTSAETYVHTIGGETFTVDYTGLDATGNRTTTTLSKV